MYYEIWHEVRTYNINYGKNRKIKMLYVFQTTKNITNLYLVLISYKAAHTPWNLSLSHFINRTSCDLQSWNGKEPSFSEFDLHFNHICGRTVYCVKVAYGTNFLLAPTSVCSVLQTYRVSKMTKSIYICPSTMIFLSFRCCCALYGRNITNLRIVVELA